MVRTVTLFECEKCQKSYKRKDNLKRHQKYGCGIPPQFPCPHCPHHCSYKSDLRRHVFNKHSNFDKKMILNQIRIL